MKISTLRNDRDRLELKLVPKAALWMFLFGILLLGGGLVTIWLLGCVTHVGIDGRTLTSDTLFLDRYLANRLVLPIEEIEEINTKIYSSGVSRSYEVNLVTSSREIPIRFADLDGDQKAALADQMAEALQSGREFRYQSGTGLMWTGIVLGVVCLLAGGACLVLLQTCTISVDRAEDLLEVRKRRWLVPFWIKTESTAISEIDRIGEKVCTFGSGSSAPTASSKYVFLRTTHGRCIQLCHGPMFTEESASEIREILRAWKR
ncbi:MAG: hypothetical protein AAF961_02500 [Planctomycetota bacterium]